MRRLLVGMCVSLVSGCGGSAPPAASAPSAVGAAAPAADRGPDSNPASQAARAWREVEWLGAKLFLTEDEVEQIHVESNGVGVVGDRVVWVAVDGPQDLGRLARVKEPTTVQLRTLDPEVVAAVAKLAAKTPLELQVSDSRATDFSVLEQVSAVRGLSIDVSLEAKLPDFSVFSRIERLSVYDTHGDFPLVLPPSLVDLDLGDTELSAANAVPAIAKLTRLKALVLPRLVEGDAFAALGKLSQIERLSLPGTYLEGAHLSALTAFPRLRSLTLGSQGGVDEGLGHLARLPALRVLELPEMRLGQAGLDAIAALGQLEELNLGGVLDGARWEPVGRLTALERLEVRFVDQGPEAATLARLPKLKKLTTGRSMTPAELARLSRLESLSVLSIVDAAQLRALAKLRRLRSLSLAQVEASDADFESLASLLELRAFDTGAALGPDALAALGRLPRLRALTGDLRGGLVGFPQLAVVSGLDCLSLPETRALLACF
ncbi:MAG: hypothetical protein KC766_11570 [Myxococcales bacterium]|nr:hypothetical protein [Myxococcales bacterium]